MTVSRKQIAWDKKKKEVDSWGDKRGLGIDKRIKEAVVALNMLGFPTTASCEGHLNWSEHTPWVDVSLPDTRPEWQWIGEKQAIAKVAKKRGLSFDAVRYMGDREAWVESNKLYMNNHKTEAYKRWFKKVQALHKKFERLLKEFYRNRAVEAGCKITTDWYDGIFRIYNGGADFTEEFSPKQKKGFAKRLRKYQKEWNDFACFLKQKYFKK